MQTGKAIIFSAPSGSGKTTILKEILPEFDNLEFSISACSRPMRKGEIDKKDYYFLSIEKFKEHITNNEFLEWQEVYDGLYYGTLYAEIKRIWKKNKVVLFDVDVLGGLNIKKILGNKALSLFIMPPSITALEDRLRNRSTESSENIMKRIKRAKMELSYATEFDRIILNDDLSVAVKQTEAIIRDFLEM